LDGARNSDQEKAPTLKDAGYITKLPKADQNAPAM
jgi:hypothetical protein